MTITEEQLLERLERLPTLRDQFAMAALMGILACPENVVVTYEEYATSAYRQADAMLKAREPQEQP